MKKILILILSYNSITFGISLKDYEFYNYDVFFTNPKCPAYQFDEPIYSFDGELVVSKPENVYCTYNDAQLNQKRFDSPHYNLVKLFSDPDIQELTMAYLSFSNTDILKTLCETSIEKNNVKVTLYLDKGNKSDSGKFEKIKKLLACKPNKNFIDLGLANYPKVKFRGQSAGIGYAHNKIIMAKYKSKPQKTTIVFSSGNMSAGTTLHHENWHFVSTSLESYFAKAHLCIFEGMDNHATAEPIKKSTTSVIKSGKENFSKFIKSCRADITSPEENDIRISIVPGEGETSMNNILEKLKNAKNISVAAHRFTHKTLANAIAKEARNKKKFVRFVADDDIFWAGKLNEVNGQVKCYDRGNPHKVPLVGANMCGEYYQVKKIEKSGVQVKYMETNQRNFLLHHNKYIIFDFDKEADAVHCGAGNFTHAAFSQNFENYYYITIPEVVVAFKNQYDYVWNTLATSEKDLPQKYVFPYSNRD